MNKKHNALWNRLQQMCRAWLCAAPQGFTTTFSQKGLLSARLHAALTAPGARKKGVIALCVVGVLALGAGSLFALRLEQQPAPSDEPLVVLVDHNYKEAAESWAKYYKHLYPEQRVSITTLPSSYARATGQYSAEAAQRRTAMLQEIRVQLMAGEGPDLFLTGTSNLLNYIPNDYIDEMLFPDVWKTAQAGAFADLGGYLTRDADFSRADYVEPLLDAGMLDGKQYLIPLTCDVPGVVLNAALLDATDFDEVAAARDFDGFWSELSRCVPPEQLNATTLSALTLLQGLDTPLVDYERNAVQVRSEEALARVAAVQTLNDNWQLPGANENLLYQNPPMDALRKQTLLSGSTFSFCGVVAGLLATENVETRFLPVPSASGGVTAQIGLYGAVRANSRQKTAAWLFLRIPLLEETQRQEQIDLYETAGMFYLSPYWMMNALPIHKEALRDYAKTYEPSNLQDRPTAMLGERITADMAALPDRITRGEVGTQTRADAVMKLSGGFDEQESQDAWLDTVEHELQLQLEE